MPGELRQVNDPFSTLLIIKPDTSRHIQYFEGILWSVSADESRIFQVATDPAGDPDTGFLIADGQTSNDADRPLVENQCPKDLPPGTMDAVQTLRTGCPSPISAVWWSNSG